MGLFSSRRRKTGNTTPESPETKKNQASGPDAAIPGLPPRRTLLRDSDGLPPKPPTAAAPRPAPRNSGMPFLDMGQQVAKPGTAKTESADTSPIDRDIHKIRFRTLASDRPNKNAVEDSPFERARLLLREVFAPSAPVLDKNHFAGRTNELRRAISAIENERMHLIIYGKRGWGKTSFTNTLCMIAEEAGYAVCRASCSNATTFEGIFRDFLRQIPLLHDRTFLASHGADQSHLGFDTLLPEGSFSPKELTDVLSRLSTTRVIFVFDEFDRADEHKLRRPIADTIKSFSDRSVRATLIIVGVADTLDDLLGYHESIERNVTGLPMRLLSSGEFEELISIGETVSGVSFPLAVRDRISNLSRQIPYFTRLLCLHAAQSALEDQRWEVRNSDVDYAVEKALDDTATLIDRNHRRLIDETETGPAKDFFHCLASVATNDEGDFTMDSLVVEYEATTKTHISKLSIGSKLSLLARPGIDFLTKHEDDNKIKYRLHDPMTGFYLRLIQDRNQTGQVKKS